MFKQGFMLVVPVPGRKQAATITSAVGKDLLEPLEICCLLALSSIACHFRMFIPHDNGSQPRGKHPSPKTTFPKNDTFGTPY
jgi:hypothetical protein